MDNIQQVTLTVESNNGVNNNGNTQIRAFAPPITKNYSMPLFLTPEQAEQFDSKFANAQKEFPATLVKGKLKDGKDGSYPDHYWWNVGVFDEIANDFYTQKLNEQQTVETEEPVDPKTQEIFDEVFPTESQKPKWSEKLDTTGQSIVRQVAVKSAVESLNGSGSLVGLRMDDIADSIAYLADKIEQIILGNYTQATEEIKEIS